MPSRDIIREQDRFIQRGGLFVAALDKMREAGTIDDQNRVFHEYPKMIVLTDGEEEIERTTETVDRKERKWKEKRPIQRTFIVNSPEEEDRVRAGGETAEQQELRRQELIQRARNLRITVDPDWSIARLRRELGDKIDAPEPQDEAAKLRARIAELEEIAAMKEKIAALEARLAAPADEAADLRAQLEALGVAPDKRWGVARLREELERATRPDAA